MAEGALVPLERVPPLADSRLGELAEEIRYHQAEGQRHAVSTVEHAVAIGERLIEAKGLIPHGEFEKWAEQEFGFTSRRGQQLMLLVRKANRDSLLGPDTSIRAALAAISEPSAQKPRSETRKEGTKRTKTNEVPVFITIQWLDVQKVINDRLLKIDPDALAATFTRDQAAHAKWTMDRCLEWFGALSAATEKRA